MPTPCPQTSPDLRYERFFADAEPRLRRAFHGRMAPSSVADAVAEALQYAWVEWDRVSRMDHPIAYLFRVGQSRTRRRKDGLLPAAPPSSVDVEPGLIGAMQQLPGRQREVVWLVDACNWTPTEAAEALDLSLSAVRTHRQRGLRRLRTELGVTTE